MALFVRCHLAWLVGPVLALAWTACRPARPPGVVAVVNGDQVLDRDLFEAFWAAQPAEKQKALQKGGRHFLLDQVIAERLLLQEAQRRGLEPTHMDRRARYGPAVREFLLSHFERTVSPQDIPEAEVRAAFEMRRQEFARPEARRVHVLYFTDWEVALQVVERARGTSDQVVHRELYEEHKYTPMSGGILTQQEASDLLGREAAEAVFALEPSETVVPRPVAFRDGWAVFISPVHFPARDPSYDRAAAQVRASLFDGLREAALDDFVRPFARQSPVIVRSERFQLIPWTRAPTTATRREPAPPTER